MAGNEDGYIVPRGGPKREDYLLALFEFINRRFDSDQTSLRAPVALRTVCDEMEAARLPIRLWNALMNVALRVLSTIRTNPTLQSFLIGFYNVLIGLWIWYSNSFITRVLLMILSMLPWDVIAMMIQMLYNYVDGFATTICQYISQRMRQYVNLITYHRHQSRNDDSSMKK